MANINAQPPVPRENSEGADKEAIRAVIDAITNAVRAKDVDAMISLCAIDLTNFDMVPPLKHKGAEGIRRLWARTLAAFDPPLEYHIHQLDIEIGGDVAFSRSLNRFGGTTHDGKRIVNWLCSTLGLRKIDGAWKLVHGHISVPFDTQSGKALLDLKP